MNTTAANASRIKSPPPPESEKRFKFSRLPAFGPAATMSARRRPGVALRRLIAGLLALAGMACSLGAAATATLVYNSNQSRSGSETLATTSDAAQAFTTGAWPKGATLSTIRLYMSTGAATATVPTLKLYTGSANGTLFATLTTTQTTIPANAPNTVAAFTAPMNTTLAASTTYWVVAEGGGDGLNWNLTNGDAEGEDTISGWSIANAGATRAHAATGAFTDRTDSKAFIMFVLGVPHVPPPPDPSRVLVHNLDRAATGDVVVVTSTQQYAQVFRPVSSTSQYALDSVELVFSSSITVADIGDLDVDITTLDASGHPDAKQFDLTNPATVTASDLTDGYHIIGPTARFTAPGNSRLTANTPYAVVVKFDQSRKLYLTTNDMENSGALYTIDNTALQSDDSGMTWAAQSSGYALSLRINGKVALADTTAPALTGAALGADGKTLTLTYGEALKATPAPAATAFTVKATPSGGTEATAALATSGAVSVSGSTVVLILAGLLAHNDTVTVSYTPGTNPVEDPAGNAAGALSDEPVANNSTVPRVSIEAVHADATPAIADPEFRITRSLVSGSALTVALAITQDDTYLSSTTQTITIPAAETSMTQVFGSRYTGNSGGALTATVAGAADHLPAPSPDDTATVTMKVPATGSAVTIEHSAYAWSVDEGDALALTVTLTSADDAARPRQDIRFAVSLSEGHGPVEHGHGE